METPIIDQKLEFTANCSISDVLPVKMEFVIGTLLPDFSSQCGGLDCQRSIYTAAVYELLFALLKHTHTELKAEKMKRIHSGSGETLCSNPGF